MGINITAVERIDTQHHNVKNENKEAQQQHKEKKPVAEKSFEEIFSEELKKR